MFYLMRTQVLSNVVLYLETIQISGFFVYISGYDDDRNQINFVMDRFIFPEDITYDYGYCHIVSYTKNGITTMCNLYQSLA